MSTEAPPVELNEIASQVRHSGNLNQGFPELEETAYFHSSQMTYSYGVHLAHVAVDAETGMMEVLKYLVVEDVGRCHQSAIGSRPNRRLGGPGHRRHDVGGIDLR